jgi:hypothetical protein
MDAAIENGNYSKQYLTLDTVIEIIYVYICIYTIFFTVYNVNKALVRFVYTRIYIRSDFLPGENPNIYIYLYIRIFLC